MREGDAAKGATGGQKSGPGVPRESRGGEEVFEEAQEEMMGNKREELRKKLVERVGFTPDQVEMVVEVMYENLKAAVKDMNNLAMEVEKVATRAAMDATTDTP